MREGCYKIKESVNRHRTGDTHDDNAQVLTWACIGRMRHTYGTTVQ